MCVRVRGHELGGYIPNLRAAPPMPPDAPSHMLPSWPPCCKSRGIASFCQIMTKGGSFLIRMGVAYICLYKFMYIKFSKRGVLPNP